MPSSWGWTLYFNWVSSPYALYGQTFVIFFIRYIQKRTERSQYQALGTLGVAEAINENLAENLSLLSTWRITGKEIQSFWKA